jgi:hypothetical protein
MSGRLPTEDAALVGLWIALVLSTVTPAAHKSTIPRGAACQDKPRALSRPPAASAIWVIAGGLTGPMTRARLGSHGSDCGRRPARSQPSGRLITGSGGGTGSRDLLRWTLRSVGVRRSNVPTCHSSRHMASYLARRGRRARGCLGGRSRRSALRLDRRPADPPRRWDRTALARCGREPALASAPQSTSRRRAGWRPRPCAILRDCSGSGTSSRRWSCVRRRTQPLLRIPRRRGD